MDDAARLNFDLAVTPVARQHSQYIGLLRVIWEHPRPLDAGQPRADVPVYSWLPPKHLVALDEPLPDRKEETLESQTMLAFWYAAVRRRLYPSESTAPFLAEQRAAIMKQRTELEELRRREFMEAPFAVKAEGLFFVNFFGSHSEWRRAFDNAVEVEVVKAQALRPMTEPRHAYPFIFTSLTGAYEFQSTRATLRLPLPTRSPVMPDLTLVLNLAKRLQPKRRPFYTLANIAGRDVVHALFQNLFLRLQHWARALEYAPGHEWISQGSKRLFLEQLRQGLFFFYEIFPDTLGSKHVLAYSLILDHEILAHRWTPGSPLGIAVCARAYLEPVHHFYSPRQLWSTVLHELAHLLDPTPVTAVRVPLSTLRDAAHDIGFYKALQYNVNIAVAAGSFSAFDEADEGNYAGPVLWATEWSPERVTVLEHYQLENDVLTEYAARQLLAAYIHGRPVSELTEEEDEETYEAAGSDDDDVVEDDVYKEEDMDVLDTLVPSKRNKRRKARV